VFERFTRLDSSRARSTGGSGLGLAIAKEIANDHHAKLFITDATLGGARFTVAFAK
jgi:signal transduction histidine kinase